MNIKKLHKKENLSYFDSFIRIDTLYRPMDSN